MPQRFLRPGITTSQRFNAVSWPAQSLFARLLTLVDDFGRYESDFRLLRSHAFPFGDPSGKEIKLPDVEKMCAELAAAGMAAFYKSGGKQFVQLFRWEERARAQSSKYPELTKDCEPPAPSPSPSPSPIAIATLAAAFAASDPFRAKWEKWQSVRRAMGRAPKNWEEMFQEQIDWLEQYPIPVAIEILSASIRNNWQGLHEPKGNNGSSSKHHPESNRNVGTANEGRSAQYRGVGKVSGV